MNAIMLTKRRLFLFINLVSELLSVFLIDYIHANKINISFVLSYEEAVKSSLYYSLKKEETLYFEMTIFEERLKSLIEVISENYEIKSCKLEVSYVLSEKYVKGVNLWLNNQIKSYQKQINIKYVMNQ